MTKHWLHCLTVPRVSLVVHVRSPHGNSSYDDASIMDALMPTLCESSSTSWSVCCMSCSYISPMVRRLYSALNDILQTENVETNRAGIQVSRAAYYRPWSSVTAPAPADVVDLVDVLPF